MQLADGTDVMLLVWQPNRLDHNCLRCRLATGFYAFKAKLLFIQLRLQCV